jgi:hypothetical protein
MNYSEKIWDLSNIITGFSVVQALAFAYRFVSPGFRGQVHAIRWSIIAGTIVFSAFYIYAINLLTRYQMELIDHASDDLLHRISWGVFYLKSSAIILAGLAVGGFAYIARP